VLRGVVIPPIGGGTVWANTVAAYETLPPLLRSLADQLWALHSNVYDYTAMRPNATAQQVQRYETVFDSHYRHHHQSTVLISITRPPHQSASDHHRPWRSC